MNPQGEKSGPLLLELESYWSVQSQAALNEMFAKKPESKITSKTG
jgi:hypothetical protein